MVLVEATVIEKWSKFPVGNAEVWINEGFITRTNEEGKFAVESQLGTYDYCIIKENHEKACQTVKVISNMDITILIKPVFRAL